MNKATIHLIFASCIAFFFSCNPSYRAATVQYKDYPVANTKTDSSFIAFLQPYADSVNGSMNTVIATLAMDIEKKQPEGTLGNLMADAMKLTAEKYYATHVDAAFVNYGGIRIPGIKAGNITKGKVFELMPFDNIIVLQKLSGKVFKQFLDHIASRGGWPVAGLTMEIKNGKAENVMINGKALDVNTMYTVANSDYVTNGGDQCDMLRPIPQINKGVLLRDGLIEYFTSFTKAGKQISVITQNRVINAQ